MINHFRTLLMNVAGSSLAPIWSIGETLIDPGFAPVIPNDALLKTRTALFGATPDRNYLNFRVAQYLALLNVSPQKQYVTASDSRLTYDPAQPSASLGNPANFIPTVSSTAASQIAVQGKPSPQDGRGWMYFCFSVSVSGGEISVQQINPVPAKALLPLTFSGGYSQAVPLGTTGYQFLVPQTVSDGDQWTVTFNIRPQQDLGQVLAGVGQIGQPNLLKLFGASPIEPYRSFYNWYNDTDELPTKLGGVILAVGWLSDAIRQSGGGT